MPPPRVYFDSSVLVAMFTADAFHDRSTAFVRSVGPIAVVSDLAVAEFSSAVARLHRMDAFTAAEALAVYANFDTWTARVTHRVPLESADILAGSMLVRRFELGLRAPDAIHIAVAQRLKTSIATFDDKMASAAKVLGIKQSDM